MHEWIWRFYICGFVLFKDLGLGIGSHVSMCYLCVLKVMWPWASLRRINVHTSSFQSASIHFPRKWNALEDVALTCQWLHRLSYDFILKIEARWKVKRRQRVNSFYINITFGDEGMTFFWQNNFWFIVNKEDGLVEKEHFSNSFASPFMSLESGCHCWHKYKCDLFCSCW